MSLPEYRQKTNQLLLQLRVAREKCRTERETLEKLAVRLRALAEAQALAQAVAEQVQTQAHRRIAEIVTRCLAIFDEPYTFKINFTRSRGKTEAKLIFERDGLEVDPLEASGGGVVDVAAFALRAACLVLRRPALRRLLILDEPFRFVSVEYRGRVRSMLERLSQDLKVQILMVTHDAQLRTGRVIRLS